MVDLLPALDDNVAGGTAQGAPLPLGGTWLFSQAYSILQLALCFRVKEVSIWGRWSLQENVGPSLLC